MRPSTTPSGFSPCNTTFSPNHCLYNPTDGAARLGHRTERSSEDDLPAGCGDGVASIYWSTSIGINNQRASTRRTDRTDSTQSS